MADTLTAPPLAHPVQEARLAKNFAEYEHYIARAEGYLAEGELAAIAASATAGCPRWVSRPTWTSSEDSEPSRWDSVCPWPTQPIVWRRKERREPRAIAFDATVRGSSRVG